MTPRPKVHVQGEKYGPEDEMNLHLMNNWMGLSGLEDPLNLCSSESCTATKRVVVCVPNVVES